MSGPAPAWLDPAAQAGALAALLARLGLAAVVVGDPGGAALEAGAPLCEVSSTADAVVRALARAAQAGAAGRSPGSTGRRAGDEEGAPYMFQAGAAALARVLAGRAQGRAGGPPLPWPKAVARDGHGPHRRGPCRSPRSTGLRLPVTRPEPGGTRRPAIPYRTEILR